MKCTFCENETVTPWRSVCAACFAEHNRREPEPSPVEILAMDITDLQDDVIELHRRLSGKPQSDRDLEAERAERVQRFDRMLALVEAVVAEKQTGV